MRDVRLQTVISSGEEYSMISMQRLEDLMVLRFFWLDLPAKITFHCSQDYYATSHTASNSNHYKLNHFKSTTTQSKYHL